jgi:uncharacterized membrane protein YkoI
MTAFLMRAVLAPGGVCANRRFSFVADKQQCCRENECSFIRHSPDAEQSSVMKSARFFLLCCGTLLAFASAAHAQTEHKRVCLTAAETRKAIAAHRLIEPFKVLKSARTQARAEPLTSRLCRWNDEFVYEITLLKRNGQVVHVFTNAVSGKAMNPKS